MSIIGWSLIYIVVLVFKGVTSLGPAKDLTYYDGSRGRMDRNYYSHDEFFQSHNRHKRNPHSPYLWAKSSESQGVSCPTRLRENSLDTLGDSDRTKEVVHIPCPKRKSAGAKVVASFKGKTTKNRGARESKKFARGNDLNQAVKQNAQWLILSSQDRIQKPNQGYMGQNFNSTVNDQNQPIPNGYQKVPNAERSVMWRNPKGAKEDIRKSSFIKPPQGVIQSNAIETAQGNFHIPQIPRLKESNIQDRIAQPTMGPNQGFYNLGPPRNIPVPQEVPNPSLYPKKDKPVNPYEANRLLINSYNMTYDGPHHSPAPNQPTYYINPVVPPGGSYPNVPYQMNPSFFQSHVTPVNGVPINTYLIVYNATLPTEPPKLFQNNGTRGPWSPGALEVDVPPGYPHQPKLPTKTTARSFDAVNIKDLPKVDQKMPNGLPNFPKYDAQWQYQAYPNEKQPDSWRYDGSHSQSQYQANHNQQPANRGQYQQPADQYQQKMAITEPPMRQSQNQGQPLGKPTPQSKGMFGKFKKEESKVKFARPAKIAASNAHRAPSPDIHSNNPALSCGRSIIANGRSEISSKNEEVQNHVDPKSLHPKGAMPLRKLSQDKSLDEMRYQDYHNVRGDMSHVLYPPVTVETALYTNKAHKIASKFVSSEEVTYVPFRGVPPARNDEAFYDRNLNFLGKIDRPPLVNIKKRKWTKFHKQSFDRPCKRLHADYPVGFYSEPVDFHSDMSADFGTAREPKVDRRPGKCRRSPDRRRFSKHMRPIA